MPQDPVNFKECSLALEKMVEQLDAMNATFDARFQTLIESARNIGESNDRIIRSLDREIEIKSFRQPPNPYFRIRPIVIGGRLFHASEFRE